MKLVKIRNSYLFKSDNPLGTHTYAVYYDRKNKRNNAIVLTHLYLKDPKRFNQVKKGNIMISKFKEFDTPSGVQNSYYSKSISGDVIDLKNSNVVKVYKRRLPRKQAKQLKNFAKRNING